MNLMDVFVTIGLDTSEVSKGLEDAASEVNSFGDKLKNGLESAGKIGVAALGMATTAATAMTGALVKGVGDVAEYGDNIDKMSQKLGISAEAYQEWDAVFQHSGTSIDTLQAGMKSLRKAMDDLGDATGEAVVDQEKLNTAQSTYENKLLAVKKAEITYNEAVAKHGKNSAQAAKAAIALEQAQNNAEIAYQKVAKIAQGETANMTDAAAALVRLGISATDSTGQLRDEEEVFSEVITALQGMENETERARLAQILLGKSGTELGALLNTSAEETQAMKDRVHELGGVMSDDAVKASARYQDSLQDMQTAFDGVKRNLLLELMPSITDIMDGLTELFGGDEDKGIALIEKGVDAFADKVALILPSIIEAFEKIAAKVGPIISEKILPAIFGLGTKILNAIIQEIPKVAGQILSTLFNALVEGAPEFIPVVAAAIASPILGAVKNIIGGVGAIKTALGGIGSAVSPATTAIGEMTTATGTLTSVAGGLITALEGVGAAALIAYDVQGIAKLVGLAQEYDEAIEEENKAHWNEQATILDNYVKLYDEKGKEVADKFAQSVTGIDTSCMTMEEAIETMIAHIDAEFEDAPHNIIDGFVKGLKEETDGVVSDIVNVADIMATAFTNFLGISSPSKLFYSYGENIIQGLQNGITDKEQSVFDRLRNIARNIANTFKKVLKIHSPSKVMEELGEFTIDGLIMGIEASEDGVEAAMDDVADKISGFDDGGYMGEIDGLATPPPDTIETMTSSTYIPDNLFGGNGTANEATRDLNIILELDGTQLARTVYRMNSEETQRVGVKLAGGYI